MSRWSCGHLRSRSCDVSRRHALSRETRALMVTGADGIGVDAGCLPSGRGGSRAIVSPVNPMGACQADDNAPSDSCASGMGQTRPHGGALRPFAGRTRPEDVVKRVRTTSGVGRGVVGARIVPQTEPLLASVRLTILPYSWGGKEDILNRCLKASRLFRTSHCD